MTVPRTAAFSILSPNYRHFARVLMQSLARQHPEWDRFVLMVGDAPHLDAELYTTVPIGDLPLPHPRQFCFRYTVLELNTAVKPWMFGHLFAQRYDRVVYFDPDIVVYSPLAELRDDAFLTLTPHLTGSIGNDEHHPSERTILTAGTYNLGFLAVTRHEALETFLRWWQEKLERDCVVDIARGLFVDQKWMDLAPGLFPNVDILRHDGYNLAYWNLAQRDLHAQPLRFFHFSGCDPAFPDLVSKHDPRQKVAEAGAAAPLIREYMDALRGAGWREFRSAPYSFGVFADGTRVPDGARAAYRNSPELQEAAGEDPFAHPELFRAHRDHKRAPLVARAALRSYRLLSRLRPLVTLVPRSMRTRMREILLGRREPAPVRIEVNESLAPGLNVIGYFSRDTGVGESARLCAAACEEAGIPVHRIDVDAFDAIEPRAVHRASIFHVNADQTLAVREQLARVFDSGAYNIGCWHWELPELPDEWMAAADALREIWAPSAFIQSAISRKVTIPVVHMPHGVEVAEVEPCSPAELGVPAGRFTFLCLFDTSSVTERKNPRGAVEAFQRAFDGDARVALLIKTNARFAIPGAHVSTQMLSRARTNGLIAACDAVVSLHRAEGFGLVLAEAMALGKPVIATGWSGNADFMNGGNSCPVAYELTTLDRDHHVYRAGQQWAEPDIDHAATLMRRVFEEPDYRATIGARARQTMLTEFSPRAAGLRYRRRLERLGLL